VLSLACAVVALHIWRPSRGVPPSTTH
jgi:hypothetical protein